MTAAIAPRISVVDAFLGTFRALCELGIVEQHYNDGPPVEAIQRSTGSVVGKDPYCCSTVSYVGRHSLGRRWPLPNTASCDVLLGFARKEGILHIPERTWIAWGRSPADEQLIAAPKVGMLFLIMRKPYDATHVGAIDSVGSDVVSFKTLEGNAANPARPSSVDGQGFYRGRERATPTDKLLYAFVDWEAIVR